MSAISIPEVEISLERDNVVAIFNCTEYQDNIRNLNTLISDIVAPRIYGKHMTSQLKEVVESYYRTIMSWLVERDLLYQDPISQEWIFKQTEAIQAKDWILDALDLMVRYIEPDLTSWKKN